MPVNVSSNQAIFYQAVLNTAVDPIVIIDHAGIICEVNAACCQLFGYDRPALVGHPVTQLMPADIASQHSTYLQRYHATGVSNVIGTGRVVTAITRNGKPVPCMLSVSRVETSDGIFFTGILRSLEKLKQAEDKIRQLALVAQHTDNAVIICDRHGRFDWVNQSFERLSGYTLEEVTGRPIRELLQGPATDVAEMDRIRAAMEALQPVTSTLVNYRKDGAPYWIEMTIEPALNEVQGYYQYIILQRDISARVQHESKLRRQIGFLHHINGWSRHSMAPDRLQQALAYVAEFCEFEQVSITLKDAAPFAERRFHFARHPARMAGHDPLADRVIAPAQPFTTSLTWPDAGSPHLQHPYIYVGLPMLAGSRCIGALGGYQPATGTRALQTDDQELLQLAVNTIAWAIENQRDKHNLESHLERLRRGQHYANIGTWDWNIQTGELFWTESISPLFGYGVGELDTSYDNFLAAVHPDDRERVNQAVVDCVEKGAKYDIDHRVVWPDGSVRWVNEKGDVQRDANGKPLKMLGVVQDIQRTKEFEIDLMVARKAAESANHAKSEFLSSMSHELRTPMNSILGFSQLLQSDSLTPDQQESVDLIYRSGQHLLELVNDVLDLAKLDSGLIKTRIEDVELHPIVSQCLTLLGAGIKAKQLQVHQCLNPECERVRADPLRLKQALLNLLSNAVKYNRPGGSIDFDCEATGTGTLRIGIRDTGYGIPANRHHEVFKPFSRLDFANSSIEGAGIGLLITQRLVDAMGGRMGFSSAEGEGSEFWIEIALSAPSRAAGVPVIDAPLQPLVAVADNRRLKILCIEDNPANRQVLRKMILQHMNAEFIEACTLGEGLIRAEELQPDLILLDIHLPDGNGIQGCQQLRTRFGSQLPIIAVTADAINKVPLGPALFSAAELKPVNMQSLLQKIRQLAGSPAHVSSAPQLSAG